MRKVGEGGPVAAGLVGARLAADLRPVGIDLNLAPVVDVDSNPNNPIIGPRSFSREPATVGACGAALITAMQAGGVAACAKHFPGHGDTETDSHHDLPVLRHDIERLRSVELPPFRDAVAAGVAAVMTTHGVAVSSIACANCAIDASVCLCPGAVVFEALDPGVPATMSEASVSGLLRNELGFQGVVISDCLEMDAIAKFCGCEIGEAAIRTIAAGVDLVLCCHEPARQHRVIDALAEAIASGRLSAERIDSAHRRLDKLFASFVR